MQLKPAQHLCSSALYLRANSHVGTRRMEFILEGLEYSTGDDIKVFSADLPADSSVKAKLPSPKSSPLREFPRAAFVYNPE